MSNVVKGRGVRVELGATYGTAIAITSVTNANPAVASAAAISLLDGSAGYFDLVQGMVQLTGQAARVKTPTATTFTMQGLNTLSFPVYTSGSFYPVLTWVTLAEATSYSIGGGAPTKLDTTTLLDVIKQEENGLLAVQTLNMKLLAQTIPTAALALIESAAQSGTKVVVRITLADGSVRVCYGEPSLPGEDVQQGAVGTGQVDFAVKGYILKGAA